MKHLSLIYSGMEFFWGDMYLFLYTQLTHSASFMDGWFFCYTTVPFYHTHLTQLTNNKKIIEILFNIQFVLSPATVHSTYLYMMSPHLPYALNAPYQAKASEGNFLGWHVLFWAYAVNALWLLQVTDEWLYLLLTVNLTYCMYVSSYLLYALHAP